MARIYTGFVFMVLLSTSVFGQSFTGTLVGTVKDPTGAVLPGVSLKLTRVDTGQVREMLTNERGDFTFVQLPVGTYQLEAEFQGFKSEVRSGLTVRTDVTSRVDIAMQVGAVSERVMVTEDAPLLESETSAVGNVINNRTVVELPLNGRKFETLVFLSPGATLPRPGSSIGFRGGVQFTGMRETSNMFILDGIDITDNDVRQPSIRPSVDAIQEFKVQNSTFSAEYGRQAGGMINVTTKSGTNDLHGTVYEFVRNNIFDAKNFFDAPNQPIPPLRRNQFGGTIGGPIRKDRTFFFGNYEELIERAAQTRIAVVPKQAWLNGDFSSLLDPSLGSKRIQLKNPLTGQDFPGNIIPPGMLNAPSMLAAKIYPIQNTGVTGPLGDQFVSSPTLSTTSYLMTGRIDHQISSSNNIFARLSFSRENITDPFDSFSGISDLPFFARIDITHSQATTISDSWTIGPTTVNEARLGFSRFWQDRTNQNTTDFHTMAGLKGFDTDPTPENKGYPALLIGSSTGGFVVGKNNLPNGRGDNNYEASDSISFRKGAHNLKVGADIIRYQVNRFNNSTARGSFTFGTRYTGFAFANFMLGWPESESRRVGDTHSFQRWDAISGFIQDDWKATPSLTVNIGLRYDLFTPVVDSVANKWVSFDPATGEVLIAGDGSNPRQNYALPETRFPSIAAAAAAIPRRYIHQQNVWNTDYNNFAPRIGFAYRLGNANVLRGGYAVFYDMPYPNLGINGLGTSFPFSVTQTATGNTTVPNLFFKDDPLATAAGGTVSPVGVFKDMKTGYVQNWTLGVQRTLANDMLFEVNYVGNMSTKLNRTRNVNQPLTDGSSAPIPSRRPYPLYGTISIMDASVAGNLHSMQTKLEKRFSSGLQYTVAYTLSHSIDNDGAIQNIYNLRSERGSSDFDIRHRLVANYVYDLPFGAGKRFVGSAGRVANTIIGNWQMTGIFTAQSGNPLTAALSSSRSNVGGADRPNAVAGVSPNLASSQRSPDHWFNTAAFSLQPVNFFGDAGRNTIKGPGVTQLDFSMFKNFLFSETKRLQFRAEIFNIMNHPNFALPDVTINGASVGKITSTNTTSRQIQLGMKLNF